MNVQHTLMAHGEYFCDNLKEANLTKSDVQEVLRKNGLKSKSEVFAVIMETTGDMSVIKQDNTAPDWSLFDDIRDSHLLTNSNKSDNPLRQ
ncbi:MULTISPECIES: YetF domain-containing protein [unclassified Psychrobacter]|uniref:YetF domain-containing protein n=1 Tax=unclassified Psychrobacter TaxID=196806 RepID=UPI0025E78A31|nr:MULTISPECIES: YetF domain-containing protein [unclassified Psychrobacter]